MWDRFTELQIPTMQLIMQHSGPRKSTAVQTDKHFGNKMKQKQTQTHSQDRCCGPDLKARQPRQEIKAKANN